MDEGDILFFRIQIHLIRRKIMTIYDELVARGLIAQVTDEKEIKELINNGKATFYIGFDPTADSLHVGHFMALCLMKRLQMAGNKPIVLIGGGTAQIGDPSGRTDMRQMMTTETINHNVECFKKQMSRFIDFGEGKAIMVNNADWLMDLNYVDVLREVGAHFSVNRMLTAECYKQRMEKGLSFLEFNYMIMQSYDFYTLFQKYGCNMEFGGDDQWSNMLGGTELIRRKLGKDAYAMTINLLLNSEGKKMGKTQSGAVWLDPNKTTPFEFFQYWRNVSDADVLKCIRMLTFLPLEEIDKMDPIFGMQVRFFEGTATFVQKIKLKGGKYEVSGYLQYGACNDENCLPPTNVEFSFKGEAAGKQTAEEAVATTEDLMLADTASVDLVPLRIGEDTAAGEAADYWKPVIKELSSFGENVNNESHSWIYIFFAGFVGGLLALFTPCVWPIIPMTVSFFLKRTKDKRKGIRDAWTYGASIVVIYVTLGLAITLIFGASALNDLSTSAVFNILFFLMLVVFAASFFGAFEITLPSKWSNAVDSKAEQTTGLLSIFLMAFTLSLVSFSCTGPIIGFLLVEVSTSESIVAPAIGMLGFAIALALPFTLFALFPSWLKSMPKSGGWMNVIKVTLGFLELAFALKFLSVADLAYGWRLLDRETFLALWIVIFALLGMYLLGKIKFPHDDDDIKVSVPRFFMALASLAFAVYMVPGLWGAPLKAVSAFAPPMQTQDFNLYKNEVHAKFNDFDAGMEYARQQGKPVMIDFTGYGCVNCRKMELAVWTDPTVSKLLNEDYVLITLYVDEKTKLPEPVKVMENGTERTLRTVGDKWSYLQRSKFGANAQPFYVLLDNEGMPLNKSYSYDEDIQKYVEFLQTGLKNYKK
jgi:tyrosyl-tRNA synthetase